MPCYPIFSLKKLNHLAEFRTVTTVDTVVEGESFEIPCGHAGYNRFHVRRNSFNTDLGVM